MLSSKWRNMFFLFGSTLSRHTAVKQLSRRTPAVKFQASRFNLVRKIVDAVLGVNRNRRERLCKLVHGCAKTSSRPTGAGPSSYLKGPPVCGPRLRRPPPHRQKLSGRGAKAEATLGVAETSDRGRGRSGGASYC